MTARKLPNTRLGWHQHFAKSFNKNENPRTAHMSLWYLFLHLAFDVQDAVPVPKTGLHDWLDKHIIEQAAAYGMTPEAKAFLFDKAARYSEIMEVNCLTE